jgi:hypothetical protein
VSLLKILAARGFSAKWCRWMEVLLKTSRAVVLVNGILGPWITCKKGLWQGDALSPYLFLLVADMLQALIKADMDIRHPLTNSSCPILQYVDDTIFLVRVDQEDVRRLKHTLEMFSATMGLRINFYKSTVTPMHLHSGAL